MCSNGWVVVVGKSIELNKTQKMHKDFRWGFPDDSKWISAKHMIFSFHSHISFSLPLVPSTPLLTDFFFFFQNGKIKAILKSRGSHTRWTLAWTRCTGWRWGEEPSTVFAVLTPGWCFKFLSMQAKRASLPLCAMTTFPYLHQSSQFTNPNLLSSKYLKTILSFGWAVVASFYV